MQSSIPRTKSSRMEFSTGSHTVKIAGYSLCNGVGIGKCIISDAFTICGYKWSILYFPDGSEKEDKAEYISVYMQLIGTSDHVNAFLKINLLDANDNPSSLTPEFSKPCIFNSPNQKFGFARFMKKCDLNASSNFLKDDCISINCNIILMKASSQPSSSSSTLRNSTDPVNTASIIQLSKGIHLLKIFGYSFIKGMRAGESIKSNTFSVGGHEWNLMFYFNMDQGTFDPQDINEYISIFIQKLSLKSEISVKVLYDIKLLDHMGMPSSTPEISIPYSDEGRPIGFTQFIKKSEIEALGFIRNDSCAIKCTIITIKESTLNNTQPLLPSSFTSSVIDLYSGSHSLTISGYSCSKGIGINKRIESNKFTIGGLEWCLVYYPDGCNEEDRAEYISFQLLNTDENVEALFQINLLYGDRESSSAMLNWYSNMNNSISQFMKKSDLEASDFLNNDMFMVKCSIVVCKRSHTLLRLIRHVPENHSSTSSQVEIYTGCHYLTIIGYSESKGIGSESHITSSTFTIGGHDWCILYYPNGSSKENNAEYISVCLQLLNTTENVKVLFNVELIDGTRTLSSTSAKLLEPHVFKGASDSYGANQFLKRSHIESSSFLRDDRLQIKCTVTVLKESASPIGQQNELPYTTTSSIIELISGSHLVTIAGYSCIKGIGIGKYIVSDVLSIGGYDWSLRYGYETQDNKEYLSLFIELLDTSDNVKALYHISLLNGTSDVTRRVYQPQVFRGSTDTLGFPNFITRQDLESLGFIVDDSLTIRFSITVIKEPGPLLGAPCME